MGFFSIYKLKRGKEASLTPKEIVNGVVNLMDAKRNLPNVDFQLVLIIFNEISTNNQNIVFKNFNEFNKFLLNQIISQFDIVVPYYKICGSSKFRGLVDHDDEVLKEDYREKAKLFMLTNIYSFPGSDYWKSLISEFINKFGI